MKTIEIIKMHTSFPMSYTLDLVFLYFYRTIVNPDG